LSSILPLLQVKIEFYFTLFRTRFKFVFTKEAEMFQTQGTGMNAFVSLNHFSFLMFETTLFLLAV